MRKRGFTLIELIVVMAIISILVLLGVPKYKEYTNQARLTKLTVEAKELEKASQKYYMTYNDWPRLNDEAYTAEQLKSYAEDIFDKTGKVVVLDVNGDYYNISYAKLSNYINEPKGSERYILQNPVGIVYYLDNLTEIGKQVIKPIEIILDNPNSIFITEVPLGSTVKFAGMDWIMINSESGKLVLATSDSRRSWDTRNTYGINDYGSSAIRQYLNNESSGFLSKIPTEYRTSIVVATWYCGNKDNETSKSVQDKIGLITYSENTLLNVRVPEYSGRSWSITPHPARTDTVMMISDTGGAGQSGSVVENIRPSLYLKPEISVILNSENVYVVE